MKNIKGHPEEFLHFLKPSLRYFIEFPRTFSGIKLIFLRKGAVDE